MVSRQAKSNEDLLGYSSDHMNDIVLVEKELELLHISRTDNPYLQVLSSQDHLDRDDLQTGSVYGKQE